MSVERKGFCLGCGEDVGTVSVPTSPYRRPPQGAVPSWCEKDACMKARENFHKICEQINNEGNE